VQQPPGGLPVVAVARQIYGRRVAWPPARRPRCELRSARRLEARPGPPGHAAASNRACLSFACCRPCPPVPPAPSTLAAPGRWGVAWRIVSKPGQAPQAPRRVPGGASVACTQQFRT